MNVLDLWMPVVATGIATHIYSTVAWMALPHHKPEWVKMPMQEEFLDWLKSKDIKPGQYAFPFMEDGPSNDKDGCNGTLIVWDSPVSMGTAIGKTLAFFFVTAFVIGYVASHTLPLGSTFMEVFRMVATIGLLAHCFGNFPGVFWFKRKVAMDTLDGVIQAVITGLIFAALWPAA